MRPYLVLILNLVINDIEHLFIHTLDTCLSLEKYLIKSLALYVTGLFVFVYAFYYILIALGLHYCVWASSTVCGEWGLLCRCSTGFLLSSFSYCIALALWRTSFSSCGTQAYSSGMWGLPRPGIEPVSPALQGRFITTVPAGKPQCWTSFHVPVGYLCITCHSEGISWPSSALDFSLTLTALIS